MAPKILVPLDGSVLAERALPYAKDLASAVQGAVTLLWVLPEPPEWAAGDPMREVAPRQEAERYLNRLTGRLAPVPVEAVVAEGNAAETILAETVNCGIHLVVMSTHGRSGLGRWMYGSVADQVMRAATVPILLVSATTTGRPWPADRAPRILIPLDYSALSETALAATKDLAKQLGAEIILLSVAPILIASDGYGTDYLAYNPDADLQEREKYLLGQAARLQSEGFTVKTRTGYGFPGVVIVDVAREENVDLIAMSTHGNGGVTRLLMGSAATSVIQRAPVPVLIVRPREVREHELQPTAKGQTASATP